MILSNFLIPNTPPPTCRKEKECPFIERKESTRTKMSARDLFSAGLLGAAPGVCEQFLGGPEARSAKGLLVPFIPNLTLNSAEYS